MSLTNNADFDLAPDMPGEQDAILLHSTLSQSPLVVSPTGTNGADEAGAQVFDVAESLRTLPELARQLVNADFGAVTLLTSEGKVTHMIYAGMAEEQAAQIGSVPKGVGLLGKLGENNAPLRLEDIASHPQSAGFPENHPEMKSLIGVKVTSNSGGAANLYVANLVGRPGFTTEDENKITTLASYASLALDNARLYSDERQLRANSEAAERRLEAVIRGSAAGVVVKNAESGEIVQVSAEALRIAGMDFSGELPSDVHPFESLYHHIDGTPMARAEIPMNAVLSSGVPAGPVEVLFIKPNGERLPVLVSAAPVFGVEGKLDSSVCTFVDVTKLKELDRAKDDFLSMITHDLRTPLTTIKGMAAAALSAVTNSDNEKAVSYLEPMDDEVDYLTELVSNLLDMTRIEAGGDVLDLEECHLADIAQDSVGRMSRSRDGQGRSIHLNVAPDLPPLYADPRQIGRVLDNLLSNALKYSFDGISLTARTDPGSGMIRAEVTDRGPGIPSDMVEAIFDRFARVKSPLSKGRQGSGLGLAICRSIIGAHLGKIGVSSSDRGAVFWFTLPPDAGLPDVRLAD